MKNYLLFIFLILLFSNFSNGNTIEELETEISRATQISMDNPDSAMNIFNNIEQEVLKTGEPRIIAEYYRRKANCYYYKSDFITAEEIYLKALEIRKSIETENKDSTNQSEIANLIYNLAIVTQYQGKYFEAIEYTKQLEKIYLDLKDYRNLAFRCYNYTAKMYYFLGDYEKALIYSYKETDIGKKIQDTISLSYSIDFQAVLMQGLDLYDEALKLQLESMKLREQIGDSLLISYSFNNIGSTYIMLEDYQKAKEYFEKSMAIKLKYDSSGLAQTYNNLGIVYQNLSLFDESEACFKKSYEVCSQNSDSYGLAKASINLANILNFKKDFKLAESYYTKAFEISLENGYKDLIIDATSSAQEFYFNQKQFDKAYEMLLLNTIYKDSVKNDDVIKKITRLEAEHEFNQKQVEDSIVRHQKKIKEQALYNQEIRRKELLLWVFGIAFFFIIAIIFVAFKTYQLRKQNQENILKQKALEIEKNLLRSQMNPHFIFNAMNSIQNFISENDSYSAIRYLSKFAKLIRLILENSLHQTILLCDEILSLQLYLELEQVRFNNRFDFSIDLDEDIDEETIQVPPMLIQPFVENAIIHGIMPLEHKGLIKISIREKQDNSCLVCEIIDNGIGREKSAKLKQKQGKTHKSVGMQLTRERLASLNSETEPRMSFNITDVLDEQSNVIGTKVIIQIPYLIA